MSSAVSFAFLSLCDETAAFAVGGTAAGNFRFLATVVSSSSYRQKYQSLELNKWFFVLLVVSHLRLSQSLELNKFFVFVSHLRLSQRMDETDYGWL